MNILVCDSIADAGLEILRQNYPVDVITGLSPADLCSIVGKYDAVIVRSQTRITADVIEAADKLQVIGRAGVGVDNIDVEAATRRGIAVVNSPEGNITSTAEYTLAMLLALARHIPTANAKLSSGVWERGVKGIQVRNKTVGIIGLGRVGTEVAEMARSLHMEVVAYDPMISESRAERLGIKMLEMEDLLKKADFITIHVPLNPATRGMIAEKQIKMMKPTAMVINCARGGIIDEDALYKALEEGVIAGAAVDVFSKEPAGENILLKSSKVIVTPHMAASTAEAEKSASIDIAEQVIAVLKGSPAKYPVNAPLISAESMSVIRPYIEVGLTLGKIAAQLMEGQLESISILYEGHITEESTSPIKAAVLAGLLGVLTEERVNMINTEFIAGERGLKIIEQKDISCENYTNMVTIELATSSEKIAVAGSSLRNKVHIVRVNDFWLEIAPTGRYMVFTEHEDQPGMIGKVGTIIGNNDINISQMQVSRGVQRGGKAMMVFCLDDTFNDRCIKQLVAIPHMHKLRVVKLDR